MKTANWWRYGMTKDSVALLEIGSQKITCIIGQRGVNGTFLIKSLAECEYEGFCDGNFFDQQSLSRAISEVLKNTSKAARTSIGKLFVSVPGEFSYVKVKESSLAFTRKKRIRSRDIQDLFDQMGSDDGNGYVLTDAHAIHYRLDDNRRVYDAEGLKSFKISALISYVYTSKVYVKKLKNICNLLGVSKVEFISESLAESKYLVPKEERDLKRIIVDVGYLTTNVLVTYGSGLLYQKAFSYGGGYITADLIKTVEVDRPIDMGLKFEMAERLKRKINLGYDIKTEGYYQLTINDEDFLLPLQKSNFTVRFCLDQLAGYIDGVMKECPLDLTINAPIAITGGGIAYMRGAKEYISSRLEMPVQIIAPQIPFMNKPDESASLSLLNEALERNGK